VVTKRAAENSTSTAAIAKTLRAIVFCLVEIIHTFLVNITVYEKARQRKETETRKTLSHLQRMI
jgi:hypothetical protein